MEFTARRVVTGHDADGPRRHRVRRPAARGPSGPTGSGSPTGCGSTAPPTTVDDGGEVPDGPRQLEPPPGGCSVMLIRFPAEGGGDWIRVDGDDPDRPGHARHRHARLHGRDRRSHRPRPRRRRARARARRRRRSSAATAHRWRVAGDEPCTYVVCMLRPDPGRARRRPPQLAATAHRRGTAAPPRRRPPTPTVASYALADGYPPVRSPPAPTTASRWSSSGRRAARSRAPDQGGDPEGGWELEPRGGGVAFRWVRLPAGHDPGEAGWHTTATIDVDIVRLGAARARRCPTRDPVVHRARRGRRAARHPPQVAAGRRRGGRVRVAHARRRG